MGLISQLIPFYLLSTFQNFVAVIFLAILLAFGVMSFCTFISLWCLGGRNDKALL